MGKKLLYFVLFIFLTMITQVGGIALALGVILSGWVPFRFNKPVLIFLTYCLLTYAIVPFLAPAFGRERVENSEKIKPTSYITIFLNRNYVKPELNELLRSVASRLPNEMELRYLDANFPFMDEFPLLPHLSHKDGKKIDLSLVYHSADGNLTNEKPSRSGYGVFANPTEKEFDQTAFCRNEGYWQYDFPKYLTLGVVNEKLVYSNTGTKALLQAILAERSTGKVFIERHLRERMGLKDSRLRFQGCRAVRHDDHIHLQLK